MSGKPSKVFLLSSFDKIWRCDTKLVQNVLLSGCPKFADVMRQLQNAPKMTVFQLDNFPKLGTPSSVRIKEKQIHHELKCNRSGSVMQKA